MGVGLGVHEFSEKSFKRLPCPKIFGSQDDISMSIGDLERWGPYYFQNSHSPAVDEKHLAKHLGCIKPSVLTVV